MFYRFSSLISLPDISKWNTQNINNLNCIFENCSLLTFIPNISKWKFNYKIKINNIFKGCNSLIIIPDISKWKISITDWSNFSDISYDNYYYNKTDLLLSKDILKYSDFTKDSILSYDNEDFSSIENKIDNSGNEELDDYYDNFYK